MSSNDSQRGKQSANDNRDTAPESGTTTGNENQQRDPRAQQPRSEEAGQPGHPSTQSGRTAAQGQHTASGTDAGQRTVPVDGSNEVTSESSQALGVGSNKYDSGKQTHR